MNDVLIIGAGPAGSAAAIRLGRLGVRNVVMVDRHDFPRHKTCGGGVSPKAIEILKYLGVWNDIAVDAYRIAGLRLVTPGGQEAYISGGESVAAIICQRRILDNSLLQSAVSLGACFIPRFEAQNLIFEGGRVGGVIARDGRAI